MITQDSELRDLLINTQVIATVGVSAHTDKPSHWIFYYLMQHGYQMIPVNPAASEIFGLEVKPSLDSIGRPIDVVQIFRRAEDVPPIVEAAIHIGAKAIWMQKGIVNHDAASLAEASGLKVVMDQCMMEAHERLLGGIFTFGPGL